MCINGTSQMRMLTLMILHGDKTGLFFHVFSQFSKFSKKTHIGTYPFSTKSPYTSRAIGKPTGHRQTHGLSTGHGRGSQHHLNEVVAARLGRSLIVARPQGVRGGSASGHGAPLSC